MRSVVLRSFGEPSVLRAEETPDPEPGAGEVLVRTGAAGVNWFDALLRRNAFVFEQELPAVLGVEVAGRVEAVGDGADPDLVGRRMAAALFMAGRAGGYAERVAAPVETCVTVPDGVTDAEAVALMVQGLTALHAVRTFEVAGKSALVLAAAGGVGSLIVQLLRRGGARVTGAVGSDDKISFVETVGADAVMTYDALASARDTFDLVFDFAGTPLTESGLRALAPRGRLLAGAMGRSALDSDALSHLMEGNRAIHGFSLGSLVQGRLDEDLTELFDLRRRREISAMIGGDYAFDQASAAHAALESRRTLGKLVLTPKA